MCPFYGDKVSLASQSRKTEGFVSRQGHRRPICTIPKCSMWTGEVSRIHTRNVVTRVMVDGEAKIDGMLCRLKT